MSEVIYILWLRQLKHYWNSKSRLLSSLGQPLLFLVTFGFGFSPMYAKASGGASYMDFLAPGIVSMSILFTAVFSGLEVIWDRQFQYFAKNLSSICFSIYLRHSTINLTLNFRLSHSSIRSINISNLNLSSSMTCGPLLTIVKCFF